MAQFCHGFDLIPTVTLLKAIGDMLCDIAQDISLYFQFINVTIFSLFLHIE
jgi:hypothetical protein